jgi:hypothetical protein
MNGRFRRVAPLLLGCVISGAALQAQETPGAAVKLQATKAVAQAPQTIKENSGDTQLGPVEKWFTQLITMKKFVWVGIIVAFIQGRRMLRKLEKEKAEEAKEAGNREAFEKPHNWRY